MGKGHISYYYERATGDIIPGSRLPSRRAQKRHTKEFFWLGKLSPNQSPYFVSGRDIMRIRYGKAITIAISVLFHHWLDNPGAYPDAAEKKQST